MADIDQQPHQNLSGAKAHEMIREVVTEANVCMLVTRHDRFPFDVRPMANQGVDHAGTVWFISSSESDKNKDIASDPRVTLIVQDNSKYRYLQLIGRATLHRDRALIDRYWTPMAKGWFDGKDDPRIELIAVHLESGHYWSTQDGRIVSGLKVMLSALGAKVDDGGVDGELKVGT